MMLSECLALMQVLQVPSLTYPKQSSKVRADDPSDASPAKPRGCKFRNHPMVDGGRQPRSGVSLGVSVRVPKPRRQSGKYHGGSCHCFLRLSNRAEAVRL